MNKREMDRCLVRIAAGDAGAFSQFYTETRRGLFAFLYPYFRNVPDTEDALQTVFLKVRRHAEQYRPHTDARAWTFQIAKNHALNECRKRGRETALDESLAGALEAAGMEERGSVFAAMSRVLDETETHIVVLHVLWGYRHREVAALLGLPLGTVCSKYQTALKKLRAELKEER